MEKLLPEHFKDFWQTVERHEHSAEDYTREYDRARAEYRQTWERALILPAHDDLRESLLAGLGSYTQCADVAEVRRRCEQAVTSLKREWEDKPDEDRPHHIVHDFEPTFERMRVLDFYQVWRDEWLWGHQVFQKL